MMMYVLIGLSLSLVGVAGMQFFYLAYLERIERERKIRLVELEHKCRYLSARLKDAERQIAEQNEFIDTIYEEDEIEDDEVWADVIEDR